MTLAPFARLESRVNRAVQAHLANATATHAGGAPFGVLFDRRGVEAFGGAADMTGCTASFCVVNAPGLREGGVLHINGTAHTVVGPVQPDAGGWATVAVSPR